MTAFSCRRLQSGDSLLEALGLIATPQEMQPHDTAILQTFPQFQTELREVFMSLSQLDDFPPANYLWNADQLETPLYSLLREKRAPVLRFKEVLILRQSAKITIEYGELKPRNRTLETIQLRRDWRGVLIIEDRQRHVKS